MSPTVYTDTSVFGGVFDDEFEEPSRAFFGLVRAGRFLLLVSLEIRSPQEVIDYEDEDL